MNKIEGLKNKIIDFVNKHRIWSAAIILFVLLVLFIFRPSPPKPVSTEKVSKGNLVQSIAITGTVGAKISVDLSFLAGGKLTYLGAQKGDYVGAYQTIAVLDQRTAQKNLEKALLDYNLQRSTFDQTLEDNQNRTPNEALNNEMKRILEQNQWNLEKAVNSVELQDLVKQQLILTTPIAGIVTRADIKSAGVNVGGATLFTVTDPNLLEFKMEVDEADITRIRDGQEVEITLDPYPETKLKLKVDRIDFITHTTSTGGNAYDVIADIPDNPDYKYRVGMNGNADIVTGRKNNALIIPLSSIVDEDRVLVKIPRGFVKRTVKLGLQTDTSAEVVSGLSLGEEVASEPSIVPQQLGIRIPFLRRLLGPAMRAGR